MSKEKYKDYTIEVFEQEPNVEYSADADVNDLECIGTHGYRIYKKNELIYEDATNQWDYGACLENAKQDINCGYANQLTSEK